MKQTHPTELTEGSSGIVPYLTSGTAQSYSYRQKCGTSSQNSHAKARLGPYRLRKWVLVGQMECYWSFDRRGAEYFNDICCAAACWRSIFRSTMGCRWRWTIDRR